MSWMSQARERVRALLFRAQVDAETEEEMRFHLDMDAAQRAREQDLEPMEARRQAALAFGGVARHREAVSDERSLGWLSGISLDLKLGARMLVKHPGLTMASVLSMAFAVALAAGTYEFLTGVVAPTLPLPGGRGIVMIQQMDQAVSSQEPRVLHDFEQWRAESRTLHEFTAVSTWESPATTGDGRVAGLRLAQVTPEMFVLTRVAPVLGRPLGAEDVRAGAPLAAVISHEVWQQLFDGDPGVLGRTLRVRDTDATVVGVMPADYGFPVNQQVWLPLRERAIDHGLRAGPALMVFARVVPGRTLAQAQAEFETFGELAAQEQRATHEHLRPQVSTLKDAMGMSPWVMVLNLPVLLFLLVVCVNVSSLIFARTAARSGEIAVRSALGASRRRLVAQLVAESLVLTLSAALLGLAAGQLAFSRVMALFWEVQQTARPFFFSNDISPQTALYVLALALLAALVVGGLPALKATRRDLRSQLPGGARSGGFSFGSVSTVVVVAQVAICVAFLPFTVMYARDILPEQPTESSFPADRFVSLRAAVADDMSGRSPTVQERAFLVDQLKQRLTEVEGVTGVGLVNRLPGMNHVLEAAQVEGDSTLHEVRRVAVDADLFDVVHARMVAGRSFGAADFQATVLPIIVDSAWAATVFGGRSAVGQRLRFVRGQMEAPWAEIIGVVAGMQQAKGPAAPVVVFQPLRAGEFPSVYAYVRTDLAAATVVPHVQPLLDGLDARLAVDEVMPLSEVWRPIERSAVFFAALFNVAALVITLFALAGTYALMSFTVTQRTREIAVRAALGAGPGAIIGAIFSRAVRQLAAGVVIGMVIIMGAAVRSSEEAVLVSAVAVSMLAVGVAACVVPATRALRVQPVAALKQE